MYTLNVFVCTNSAPADIMYIYALLFRCDNPIPRAGGLDCVGPLSRACNVAACVADAGMWIGRAIGAGFYKFPFYL